MGGKSETRGQAKQRHKLELRNLQNEVKAFQKKAKKDRLSKKEVEAQVQQMESDVARRHEEELQAFETEDQAADANGDAAAAPDQPAAEAEAPMEAGVPAKVAKAQRRREAKKRQERERRERIEEANKHTVSARQVEADVIQAQLARQGLAIKDIPSDGHCMYHAVADQMKQHALPLPLAVASSDTAAGFQQLRRLTASYMRAHAGDFAPFLALDEGVSFEDYCGRVADSADWGGQLELRALACALQTPIEVFSADADALLMGAEFLSPDADAHTPKLQLTYHVHYYALGEHFNSVQRVPA